MGDDLFCRQVKGRFVVSFRNGGLYQPVAQTFRHYSECFAIRFRNAQRESARLRNAAAALAAGAEAGPMPVLRMTVRFCGFYQRMPS